MNGCEVPNSMNRIDDPEPDPSVGLSDLLAAIDRIVTIVEYTTGAVHNSQDWDDEMIDDKRTYWDRIKETAENAKNIAKQLSS